MDWYESALFALKVLGYMGGVLAAIGVAMLSIIWAFCSENEDGGPAHPVIGTFLIVFWVFVMFVVIAHGTNVNGKHPECSVRVKRFEQVPPRP